MGNEIRVVELIKLNKVKILPELYDWAETFNPENIIHDKNKFEEEDEDELIKSYDYVLSLFKRLENNQCSGEDFDDILFHIDQINYNEIKITI